MAKLIVTGGDDRGKEFSLGQTQTIGRLSRNDIAINGEGISRQHARLAMREGRWYIVDLNSKNGISINGRKIHKSWLDHGDLILIGSATLRLEDREAPQEPGAQQPSGAGAKRGGAEAALGDITYGGRSDGSSSRVLTSQDKPSRQATRTTLLWLRGDFTQIGGAYKVLLWVGLFVVVCGLGYLAFTLAGG